MQGKKVREMKKMLSLLFAGIMVISSSAPSTARADTIPRPEPYRINGYETETPPAGHREFIVEVLWDQGTKQPAVVVGVYNQTGRMVKFETIPVTKDATWAMGNVTIAEKGEYLKVMVVDPTTYAPLATAKTFGK